MQRQFTSGSRQAPDPFDQFLEENNFYRKHTARDASCLFRVISEQMYDTQLHHLAIRKKCVRYMRKHRDYFAPLVERDLDEYLDDMSKPKTYGTLIELQAVGYMFQRNVLLFEPFNLGNFYSSRSYFNDVFRVFYTPERHFDSVFTCDYIKDAAICQAICYEILYKDLYKLPDVAFAVEHMLHSPTLDAMEYTSESNDDGYCTRIVLTDGRSFHFDLPDETNCILENYELCHFHHTNFPRLSDDLHREMKIHTNCDDFEKSALCKTAESLLPHKYISCVRQLLQEGITPFPYKVAKALDPNMYRNIEFDAWNEQRKEQKLQNWYNGDTNFKVGAKCHVKLCKSENDVYTCHIQEIAVDKGYCIVFIEQLGEKRLVPYESLTPLPPDQFKPWSLPYRFQRHMQKYSSVRLTRHYNYRFKLNGQFASAHEYCAAPLSPNSKSADYVPGIMDSDASEKDEKQHYVSAASHHRNGCYYKLKQYTHFENFRAHTVEYCAMPLTVEHAPREQELKSGNANATPSHENQTNVVARTVAPETRIKTETNVQQQQQQQQQCMRAPEELVGTFNPIEQSAGIGAPAFILPDFHYLYPVPQYAAGMPEEYYTYGYDPAMHPPPATALMPTGYYMYPPPGAPPATFAPAPNNFYMPTAAPLPPPLITAATAPHPPSAVAPNIAAPFYQTNTHFGSMTPAGAVETPSMQNAATQAYETPITHNRSSGQTPNMNTPVTGRINWDAKKSVEVSGVDLPTDVATLRHFYNLGLEYHLMHMKQRCNEDNAAKATGPQGVTKVNGGNQNEDVTLEPKLDSNNNSMQNQNLTTPQTNNINGGNNTSGITHTTHNQNSNNHVTGGGANSGSGKSGGGHMHRRFPSRYYNSNKERPLFLRNQNNANSNVHSSNNHNQSDYNNSNGNVGNKYASSLKSNGGGHYNSNRSNTPNSTNSHTSGHNAKAANLNTPGMGSGVASLAVSVAEHGMPSPQGNFDNANGVGKMITHPQMPVYQTPNGNTLIAAPYNPYNEFNGDPSMSIAPPNTATGGGIILHMPMPAPAHTFGIYAPPQPGPPPGASMGMHPTPTSTAVTYGVAPNGGPPQQFMPSPSDAVPIQAPSNGYYPTPAELTTVEPNGTMHAGGDGLQFQCIPYPGTAPPPPMPFYYTAGSAVAPAGGMPMNGIATVPQPQSSTGSVNGGGCGNTAGVAGGPSGPQGYWCQPPNALLPLPTSTPQMNGSSACVSTSSNNSTPNMTTNTTNSRPRDSK
ncbi:uncharacterized protein LOC126759737 isoform X1 [Bactrocera neohumeralis]|uniref:uncharacterized protein LOC126759737 isoform X1 n=1 Tax=Bactrocera neohumeralis TaxID=98809 RepID=UPI0021654237|nr:uncharacterized protein LOC126759737 isoform X1 [Bactrocera neohumeralis]XP_050330787.1 uncharacterized protein LOC126759737 isoform X1 [Bactrocera neohumeralis]